MGIGVRARGILTMADTWSVVETRFDPSTARAYEGLFTLGSGYLHVRGSLEEHLSGAPQNVTYTRQAANVTSEKFPETPARWGTYVPGVFGRHPMLNNEMVNLPWFLGLVPVVDGERLDLATATVNDYRRELRLDAATLRRSLVWRTRSGQRVRVEFERFVSAARPHLGVQRLSLTSDGDADAEIHAGVDADVRTNGYDHFADVATARADESVAGVTVRTDAGDTVTMLSGLVASPSVAWDARIEARSAVLVARTRLSGASPLVVEKRTVVGTSRDLAPRDPAALLADARRRSYDDLLAEHTEHWARRWRSCDVIIDGDDDAQRAMRVALFHLLRAHVPDDPRVAIDAKGYAGEAYWGRYFWDTEMFLLPFFVYTDPARARTLVDFRVQSLPGARANAARYGYAGARYAWESDATGLECCPNWQYADHEVHVTADVAYGLVHYARAAADPAYLRGPAAAVLVETARYWLQRLDWRPGDEGPSLLGVMGPDEYTPISNNNAYTNRLVAHALAAAAEHGDAAGHGDTTAASPAERAAFAEAAHGLPILRGRDGVLVLQCEEFERLAEPRFDELWPDRSRTFAAGVSQERLYRSKCLKQADVLMLMALFPQEFSDAEVRRAWDYYVPYTTHDSSLSAGVHAILAARLGLADAAWAFWRKASAIDLDFAHGGAAEGIHIANAGAVWQMAVLGFAGLRTAMQAEHLTLHPRLPAAWKRLAFPLVWKGAPVRIEITPGGTRISNDGDAGLVAQAFDEQRLVPPRSSELWPRRA